MKYLYLTIITIIVGLNIGPNFKLLTFDSLTSSSGELERSNSLNLDSVKNEKFQDFKTVRHKIDEINLESEYLDLTELGLGESLVKNFEISDGLKNFVVEYKEINGFFSVKAGSIRGSILDSYGNEKRLIINPKKEIFVFEQIDRNTDICACSKHYGHSHSSPKSIDLQYAQLENEALKLPTMIQSTVVEQTIITLMAVYDSDAQTLWESEGSSVAQEIAIQEQVANEVLSNSNSGVRVDFIARMEYDFDTSGSASTFINEIIYFNPVTPEVAHIRATRNKIGADVIVFFYETQNYAGSAPLYSGRSDSDRYGAYLTVSSNLGYSLVLAHELGHVLGCGHAKSQTVAPGPGYNNYSAGYYTDSYRTIMTYSKGEGKILARYFSSPELTLDNELLGNAANDNRRTILETKGIIANYRSTTAYAPTALTAVWSTNSSIKISWDNSENTGADSGYPFLLYEIVNDEEILIYSGLHNSFTHENVSPGSHTYKIYFDINGSKTTVFGARDITTVTELSVENTKSLIGFDEITGFTYSSLINQDGKAIYQAPIFSQKLNVNTRHLVGVGDINLDGIDDMIWQAYTPTKQKMAYWLLNSENKLDKAYEIPTGTTFNITNTRAIDTTDLNLDGIPDILFHLSNNQVAYWPLKTNGTRGKGSFIGQINQLQWEYAGNHDLSGDGIPDIVWHEINGSKVIYWVMNQTASKSHTVQIDISLPYGHYIIVGYGDINLDGHNDLIFQNTNNGGVNVRFLDSRGKQIGKVFVGGKGNHATWEIKRIIDINNDSVPDIQFRNKISGEIKFWKLGTDGLRL